MSLEEKIQGFFFEEDEKKFSSIKLLEKHIKICLCLDEYKHPDNCYQAIWPGMLAIFAGIDLLAYFYTNNDDVGARFIDYCKKYFCSESDANIVYQLRNAMVHSYNLLSDKNYRFVVYYDENHSNFIDVIPIANSRVNGYSVNLFSIYERFVISVEKYYSDIQTELQKVKSGQPIPEIIQKFESAFDRKSTIVNVSISMLGNSVGEVHNSPTISGSALG